jgi:urease accessory protein
MHGHLDLLAARAENGATVLRRQSFAPPLHISKPHHDAGWLVVNLASPTPGLFAGDRIEARVEVEPGARLLLTAPSANRIHTMSAGHAELNQTFRIAAGGMLDVWPEYLLPQKDARYRQHTRIEVEPGGTLLWTESIAPGRAARGEAFAFTELRLATDIFHGSTPLVRERYALTPGSRAVAALQRKFPEAYYASVVCVTAEARAEQFDFAALPALQNTDETWIGVSRLAAPAIVVKVVAANSPALRRVIALVREQLFRWLKLAPASLRRVTGAPTML